MTNKLNLKTHIDNTLKQAAKSCSMIYQLRYYLNTSTLLKINKTHIQPIYHYSVLIYGRPNKTDIRRLKTSEDSCGVTVSKLKIGKSEQFPDKHKLCLVRELHVYEIFKLMIKVIRQSCGYKKLHEKISEQEIKDTNKTGKTTQKIRRRNKL